MFWPSRVIALLLLAPLLASCEFAEPKTLTGDVIVFFASVGGSSDDECWSTGDWETAFAASSDLTVRDADNKVLATTNLTDFRETTGAYCAASFDVNVPKRDIYQLELSTVDDSLTFSREELDESDWNVLLQVEDDDSLENDDPESFEDEPRSS